MLERYDRAANNDLDYIHDLLSKTPGIINKGCSEENRAPSWNKAVKWTQDVGLNTVGRAAVRVTAFLYSAVGTLDIRSRKGWTLLEYAGENGALDVAEYLIRSGASLNNGRFLTLASSNDHMSFVYRCHEVLLQLGSVYEFDPYGEVPTDLNLAREYFTHGQDMHSVKRVDRKIISTTKALNAIDANGQTSLHRAARYKFFHQYATLLHLGSKVDILDKDKKTAAEYLTADEQGIINKIDLIYQDLNIPSVDVIISAMKVRGGYNNAHMKQSLESLYHIAEIKPLFDLVKLAILCLHKLSGRFKNIDDEYDSDDEDDVTEKNKFRIRIDPNKDTIENMEVSGANGLGNTTTLGSYIHPNKVLIGGAGLLNNPMGTLLHEFCHFVIDEIYQEVNAPGITRNNHNKILVSDMADIVSKMMAKNNSLAPLFKSVFINYPPHLFAEELLVRVPQFIANNQNGANLLESTEPALLHYYRHKFLPKVTAHIEQLTKRALHHWSPQLFAISNHYQLPHKMAVQNNAVTPNLGNKII